MSKEFDLLKYKQKSLWFCNLLYLLPAYFVISGRVMVGDSGFGMSHGHRYVAFEDSPVEFLVIVGFTVFVCIGLSMARRYIFKRYER